MSNDNNEASELRIAIARVLERWQTELSANKEQCAALEWRMRQEPPPDMIDRVLVMLDKREAFARGHVLASHVLELRYLITPAAAPPPVDSRQEPLPFEQRPTPVESSMAKIMERRN